MQQVQLEQLQQLLETVRQNLNELKERAVSLRESVECGCFIPEETALRMTEELELYRQNRAQLSLLAGELSIPMTDEIAEVESALMTAIQQASLEQERELIWSFFRLTASLAQIRVELEAAKERLIILCREAENGQTDALAPYRLVIQKLQQEDSYLSVDEYDLIDQEIGRQTARGLDRRDQSGLMVDVAMDISRYLDGSCTLLQSDASSSQRTEPPAASDLQPCTPEQTLTREDNASSQADTKKHTDEDIDPEASVTAGSGPETGITEPALAGEQTQEKPGETPEEQIEETSETEPKSDAPSPPPILSTVPKVGNTEAEILDVQLSLNDTSARQLSAKSFNRFANHYPESCAALWYFGNVKLVEKQHLESQNGVSGLFQWVSVSQMLKKGYLTEFVFRKAGAERIFLTLTSMGWACFRKSDIIKHLKKGKRSFHVPEQMLIQVSELTQLNVTRLVLIYDYIYAGETAQSYIIYPYSPRRFMTAEQLTNEDASCRVIAAVFHGAERGEDLQAIQSLMDEMGQDDSLRILVSDAADIPSLAEQLGTLQRPSVSFCVEGDFGTLLDSTGAVLLPKQAEKETDVQTNSPPEKEQTSNPPKQSTTVTTQPVSDTPTASPAPVGGKSPVAQSLMTPSIIDRSAEMRDSEQEDAYYKKGLEMLCQGQFPHALALFRSLGRYSEENLRKYEKLAYALDDPARAKHYKYSELLQIFDDEPDNATDALRLSAYLRIFFSYDTRTELYYLQNCVSAVENNKTYLRFPQLKELVYELGKVYQDIGRGFDPVTVDLLLNAQGRESEIEEVRSNAISLLESRLEEVQISNNRVKATCRQLFGRGSLLFQMLSCVSNGTAQDAQTVSQTLESFAAGGFLSGKLYTQDDLSDSEIKRLVDDAWDSCFERAVHQRKDDLKGIGRTLLTSRVRSVLSACLSWASLSLDSIASRLGDQENALRKCQKKVRRLLEECLAKGQWNSENVEECAYLSALRHTLEELLSWLQNGDRTCRDRYYYLPFLKGHYVEVGERYLPELELGMAETTPYSVCKRIVEDSEKEDLPWEAVLHRIFTDPIMGRDYGHAMIIRKYLEEIRSGYQWPEQYDINENIASSRALLGTRDGDFSARLEMAENYGWIENTAVLERINANMEVRRQHYTEHHNYGFYFRTMRACLRQLERDAELLREPKERRLQQLRQKAEQEYPIFAEIQQLINQHRYTVAQDYMDQVEKDGIRELPEITSLTDENHALSAFISNYGTYYSYAKEATRGKLVDVYRRRHRGIENNKIKTGIAMLENWPRSEGSAEVTEGKLYNLFTAMGLPVKSVQRETSGHFRIRFKSQELTADYPHPIGAYGSEMLREGLHVFLLFGMKDANALNVAIRERITASLTGASLILADTQIQLAEKRKLAQTIKQENQNTQPYLILDRLTLLWLADYPQPDRWNLMLKCALPFHYLNPFTENSTMVICPDMFIGRRKELEQVIAPGGANIIYGGRQLGKTALLHFARNLEDHRESGKWAVFLDIKPDNAQRTAERIYEKLFDEGFFKEERDGITWDELARLITRRINRGQPEVNRLLLLLDEADRFLADCQQLDYEPVVFLRRIQAETQNRFKFVLAGLHNVIRFSEKALEGNSALPQLGSITIRPLTFKEASELLERPLSYLGFQLKRENLSLIAQILSSTNYYPGLIQFYASRLVRSVCQNNYGDVNDKPPYWLQEAQILTLLKDKEFLENIKHKFMITLGIDQNEKGYYKTLAYILADCYYHYPEGALEGYTVQQIQSVCNEYEIHTISVLKPEQTIVLLEELIVLNILRKNELHGEVLYIFNRTSFRHMLGDRQEIEDKLLEMMEKEQQLYDN